MQCRITYRFRVFNFLYLRNIMLLFGDLTLLRPCISYCTLLTLLNTGPLTVCYCTDTKRKRSDSVLCQKPMHSQKCQKGNVTTQTTPQKSSFTQRLWTDLGRSVGVTTATQLVWLTVLQDPHSHSPQQLFKSRVRAWTYYYTVTLI